MGQARRRELKRRLGLETPQIVTLTKVGGSFTDSKGHYYVKTLSGTVTALPNVGAFPEFENTQLLAKFDPARNERVIIGQDTAVTSGNTVSNGNPMSSENDLPASADSLSELRATVYGSTMTISVMGLSSRTEWYGDWYQFSGLFKDMSASVPTTAGKHILAMVGWHPPLDRLYVALSTEEDDTVDLGMSYIREAWQAFTRPVLPVCYTVLATGQTSIAQADIVSLRQFLNGRQSRWRVSVDTATHTLKTYEEIVYVDYTTTGTCTLTLPLAANALAASTTVTIYDANGNAATNNITVDRTGSDTIDGATSATISTDNGKLRLEAVSSTEWITV